MKAELFIALSLVPFAVGALSCTGNTPALTTWCNNNCNAPTPFCPAGFCSCTNSNPPPAPNAGSLVNYYESHGCCTDDAAVAYFVNGGDVYMVGLDAAGDVDGAASLCKDFVGAVDIALTSDGGLFVADFNAATVTYIAPNCGASKVVVSWVQHQIPAPNTVAISADGALLIGVNPHNVYRVVLDSSMNYVSKSILSSPQFWTDKAILGNTAYMASGRTIMMVDITTMQSTLYFDLNANNLPDIQDVAVTSECGVFFTVPDSNQLWHCSDVNNGASCSIYCNKAGIDADSCSDIVSPWGVALDCHCNAYVTNPHGGLLVRYDYGTVPATSNVILGGVDSPKDVVVYVPSTCGTPASESRTPSPTASPSKSAPAPIPGSFIPYDETMPCCRPEDAVAYFVNSGDLYYLNLDVNGRAEGTPMLCYDFINAVDLVLDANGGVFVADQGAAIVSYVSAGCTGKKTVVSWIQHQIPAPQSLLIAADGSLLIGVSPFNTYRVTFGANLVLQSKQLLSTGNFWLDGAIDGNYAFVSVNNKIYRYDLSTMQSSVYFDGHMNNLPDIQDVVVNADCGVFFAVPDSNQIWHCTDLMNGATCERFCSKANIDADTCTDVWSPWGLSLDCSCNLYAANEGGGLIIKYNYNDRTSEVILSGLFHPKDVVVYVPSGGCTSPSSSSSNSPSATASPSASPSRTPSPSASPSPSSTASPSPSPSASPSASRSASPSATRSPSPSPSPQFFFAMSIDDANAVCVLGTCGADYNSGIVTEVTNFAKANAVRVISIVTYVNHMVDFTYISTGACNAGSSYVASVNKFLCTRVASSSMVTNAADAISDVKLYIKQGQTKTEVPPFVSGYSFNLVDAGSFPNVYSAKSAVIGIVDCTGYNNIDFAVAWGDVRLCWNDAYFNKVICHYGYSADTSIEGGGTYVDADGNLLNFTNPKKKFTCVESV